MSSLLEEKFTEMLATARKAMDHAYAPYSHFTVGAALLTRSGKIFCGCNVENAAYSPSLCAERVAVGTAIAAGEREFEAILITSPSPGLCTPCGVCRQVLYEFNPEMTVVCITPSGQKKAWILKDLLPEGFGSKNFGL